jgi:hypothetical protein
VTVGALSGTGGCICGTVFRSCPLLHVTGVFSGSFLHVFFWPLPRGSPPQHDLCSGGVLPTRDIFDNVHIPCSPHCTPGADRRCIDCIARTTRNSLCQTVGGWGCRWALLSVGRGRRRVRGAAWQRTSITRDLWERGTPPNMDTRHRTKLCYFCCRRSTWGDIAPCRFRRGGAQNFPTATRRRHIGLRAARAVQTKMLRHGALTNSYSTLCACLHDRTYGTRPALPLPIQTLPANRLFLRETTPRRWGDRGGRRRRERQQCGHYWRCLCRGRPSQYRRWWGHRPWIGAFVT